MLVVGAVEDPKRRDLIFVFMRARMAIVNSGSGDDLLISKSVTKFDNLHVSENPSIFQVKI